MLQKDKRSIIVVAAPKINEITAEPNTDRMIAFIGTKASLVKEGKRIGSKRRKNKWRENNV